MGADAGQSIGRLIDPELPSHCHMICQVRAHLDEQIRGITLHRDRLVVQLRETADEPQPEPISLPFVWQPRGHRKGIVHEPNQQERLAPKASQAILTAIGKATRWMTVLLDGTSTIEDIASREGMGDRNARRLLVLACLSPKLIKSITDGNARADLTVTSLAAALPHDWAVQEQRILGA